jgi:hypothetical protein
MSDYEMSRSIDDKGKTLFLKYKLQCTDSKLGSNIGYGVSSFEHFVFIVS